MSDEIPMPPGDNSKRELAAFIARIESLEEEKAEVGARIKAEFEQAAGAGFDKKALKQILKERKADGEKSVQHRAVVDTYRRALASLAGTPLGDWARGWVADENRMSLRSAEAEGKQHVREFEELLKRRQAGERANDNPSQDDGENGA